MSEKEIKNKKITKTPVSEITSPTKVDLKEKNQNNKNSETTAKVKVEEQIENTSEIKEELANKPESKTKEEVSFKTP